MLRKLAEAIFALVFPDECRVCGQRLTAISRIPVCRKCLAAPAPLMAEHFCVCCRTPFLNAFPLDSEGRCGLCRRCWNGFDAAYAFGSYEDPLRQLVHLFKYSRIPTLAGPLGGMMVSVLPRTERFDAIVPMPLHWLRRWERGFNQARLLAGTVSRHTGIPVLDVVRRRRATVAQAGLSSAARRRNVSGAFAVKRPDKVRNLRILLVDDVFTTGATSSACSAALKRAGAQRVTVLALARTDRRSVVEPVLVAQRARAVAGVS